jgi:hypothetical protein
MAALEPISPELALVCAELREQALAQLPFPAFGSAAVRIEPLLRPVRPLVRAPGRPSASTLVAASLVYAGLRVAQDAPIYALALAGVLLLTLVATLAG